MQLTIRYSDFMLLLSDQSRILVKSQVPEDEAGAETVTGGLYSGFWGEPSQQVYYFTESMPITKIANKDIFEQRTDLRITRTEFWELWKEGGNHKMVVFDGPSFNNQDVLQLKDSLIEDGVILYEKKGLTFDLCE